MGKEKYTIGHSNFDAFIVDSGVKQNLNNIEGITNRLLIEKGLLENLVKELSYKMKEDDITICNLCKRLNPQHEDCTSCDDRKGRLDLLEKVKEVLES